MTGSASSSRNSRSRTGNKPLSGRVLKGLAVAAAAAIIVGAAPAPARRHDPEKLPETRIRDLHYGDVLFYFFQDDDFEAITRLTAYQHWKYIPHHEAEGQLLLGGLYLSLGMHNEAGERFKSLLTDDVPTGVRNKAWFYLGQIWYARGYLDKAATPCIRSMEGCRRTSRRSASIFLPTCSYTKGSSMRRSGP